MFIIFNKNLFLIIFMSIVLVYASNKRQAKGDDMCRIMRNVLCVKDILMSIATVTTNITRTANEIKNYIQNYFVNQKQNDTLNNYVRAEIDKMDSDVPTRYYHKRILELPKIDKKYLGDLLLEAHYAMSFYYNSIDDLLNMDATFALETVPWFKQIQSNLRDEMICQYRSVLYVYSHEWPLINQIKGIKFSPRQYQYPRSLVRDAHSIIITRLLREWMQRLHSVIILLKTKFV